MILRISDTRSVAAPWQIRARAEVLETECRRVPYPRSQTRALQDEAEFEGSPQSRFPLPTCQVGRIAKGRPPRRGLQVAGTAGGAVRLVVALPLTTKTT